MSAGMKSGYKQTEVGVIPEDWEVRALGDELTLQRGFDLPSRLRGEGTVPIVTSSGVSATHCEAKVSAPGIVTGRYGTIGQVFFIEEDFWPLNTTLYVRSFKGNDPLYLSYLLRTVDFASHSGKSGVPGVNRNDIHELRFPRPPLPEQRAIATALSDVDGLLGALDRLIAKKRDLRQAAMQQLLTGQTRLPGFRGEWEETTLGDIGDCIIGLTYKPEDVVDHGLLVLRSSNVQNGRLSFEDNVYVNLEVPEHLYTQVGDLLICVRNGSRALIGKCAVIDRAAAGLSFGAFMAVYRTKHWRFVVHSFQGDDIQRQIRDNVGATINQITNKDLKAFRLKLPPPGEQTAIAEVLTEMDAELAALEERREKTRALKQGMMQELLTGRTRFTT